VHGGGLLLAALAATALLTGVAPTNSDARQAAAAVRLHVAFDRDARLGASTAIAFDLYVDAHREPAAMTGLTILTAAGIDVGTSGLGLATCRPARRDLLDVLARGHDLRPCPANAVLGRGAATAAIRYSAQKTVAASGRVMLFNGPPASGRLGVVAYILTSHPIRSQLVYTGQLSSATRPFGLGLDVGLPEIPDSPFGAPISLQHLRFSLGGKDIIYHQLVGSRRRSYRPGGLPLPASCPHGGFRFRATVSFADGGLRSGGTTVPCPRR
jgi:hypothetical protein